MTHFLPPAILALFAPRAELPFLPPPASLAKPPAPAYTGLASYLSRFSKPEDLKPLQVNPTPAQLKDQKAARRAARANRRAQIHAAKWNPNDYPNGTKTKHPTHTLFIARLDYALSEEDIKKEMSRYGKVRDVKLVKDIKTGKPRGYGFVEFDSSKDVKNALHSCDKKRIGKRRIVCDIERGRTIPNWKPRRLGGGLGETRIAKKKKDKFAIREEKRDRSLERDRPRSGRDRDVSHRDQRGSDRDRRGSDRDRDLSRDRDRDRGRERARDRDRDRRSSDDRRKDKRDLSDRNRDRARERDNGSERSRQRDRGHDRFDFDRSRGNDWDRPREQERPMVPHGYHHPQDQYMPMQGYFDQPQDHQVRMYEEDPRDVEPSSRKRSRDDVIVESYDRERIRRRY